MIQTLKNDAVLVKIDQGLVFNDDLHTKSWHHFSRGIKPAILNEPVWLEQSHKETWKEWKVQKKQLLFMLPVVVLNCHCLGELVLDIEVMNTAIMSAQSLFKW